jgi:hypothetical protein
MKRFSDFIQWFDHPDLGASLRVIGSSSGVRISSMNRQTESESASFITAKGRSAGVASTRREPDPSRRDAATRRAVNRRCSPADWTDENEGGHVFHGEFESPVWVAISMAIASDRECDTIHPLATGSNVAAIPGTAHTDRGGELRNLLACVAASVEASETSRRQRVSAHTRVPGPYPRSEYGAANDFLLTMRAATILGVAIAVVVKLRSHCENGRTA